MFCPQLRNRLAQTTKDDHTRDGKVHSRETPGVVLLAHSVTVRGNRQHLANRHIIQRHAPPRHHQQPEPAADQLSHPGVMQVHGPHLSQPQRRRWTNAKNKGVVFFWSSRPPLIAADRTERMRRGRRRNRRRRWRRRRLSGVSSVSHNQIRPFVIVPVKVPPTDGEANRIKDDHVSPRREDDAKVCFVCVYHHLHYVCTLAPNGKGAIKPLKQKKPNNSPTYTEPAKLAKLKSGLDLKHFFSVDQKCLLQRNATE